MERAVEVYVEHFQKYLELATDRVILAKIPVYINIPREALHTAIGRSFGAVKEDLERGTTSAYPAHLRKVGRARAQNGTPIAEMISGLDIGFQVVTDDFKAIFGDDLAPRLWWEERRRELSYAGALAITEEFYTAREAIIGAQHREILKLTAPLIPLHEGALLMPLVGVITAERASYILESLLEGITRHRSQAVVIDVTGMLTDDASAMDHLLTAAHAARLLGAKVIVVGINPELARTIAKAGLNLGGITILGDLTSGMDHALRLLGLAITSVR
jgi:rsbT co-antagonist protein RsbR